MKFTRRKALASIGLAAVGTGAAFSSGAFSSTEVDRNFDLAIAPDENSLLRLSPTEDHDQIGEEDGVLFMDFTENTFDEDDAEGLPSQGDTRYENAFEIQNLSDNDVWVWMPVADETEGDIEDQVFDSGNRSVEFVVDGADADDFNQGGGSTLADPGDLVDLTFPSDQDKDDDDKAGGATDQSRTGMAPGGAVRLEPGTTVAANINFFVLGPRDELQEFESVVRFKASQDEPETTDDWATTFTDSVDTGNITLD